jgi:hypothetical protein
VAVSIPLGAVLPVIAALPPVGSPLTALEVVAFAGMLEPAVFNAVTEIWITASSSAATSLYVGFAAPCLSVEVAMVVVLAFRVRDHTTL